MRGMLVLLAALLHFRAIQANSVPALFAFGDSLVDSGNNNMLRTVARADHPPYGYNFVDHAATGRFSDGKLIPDFIASKLGLPFPPPYLIAGENITRGVNFGSASSGIFQWTGQGVMPLANQVDGFRDVQYRLVRRLGSTHALNLISRSIFYICTGNNDVNNFLLGFPHLGLPHEVRNSLLLEFALQVERLYNLGARKFVVVGLSAVGCIPMNQRLGRCSTAGLDASIFYNVGLATLLESLRTTFRGARIVMTNLRSLMIQVKSNPLAYGFRNSAQGCCPLHEPWRWCFDGGEFCDDPSKFMFWDMVHPTEAFNRIAAEKWWNGTEADAFPVNIQALASED